MNKPALALFALFVTYPTVTQAQTPRASDGVAATTSDQSQRNSSGAEKQLPAAIANATGNLAKVEPCGCESALPEVLAEVNGIKLTLKDIDTPNVRLEQQVRELESQVVEARRRELDLQINSKLLEAEAKKRGVAAAKLLQDEVIAQVKEPTEPEAQAFYEANKERIQGEFANIKADLIAYLREQRQREETGRLAERLRAQAQVKVLADKVTPPATPADRTRVLATLNGEPITSGDIEDSLRPLIYNIQERVYALRRTALDRKINDLLLEQEAAKRKITARALLEAEVTAGLPKVSEAEAQTFYQQNRERISGEFAQVKDQVISYLQTQAESKATAAFAEQMRRGATIQTFLKAPEPPVYNIATDDQPAKGNPTAQVTIVEFTDYQCPSCAQTQPVLDKLMNEYGDRIRLVVRDFPLSQHREAFKAAEAAEAAREQGKYWEYITQLFQNQQALGIVQLKEYASRLNLDRAKFDNALDSGKLAPKVQRDIQDGNRFGVNGTPAIFINGRRVEDRTYEGMKSAIASALNNSATK